MTRRERKTSKTTFANDVPKVGQIRPHRPHPAKSSLGSRPAKELPPATEKEIPSSY